MESQSIQPTQETSGRALSQNLQKEIKRLSGTTGLLINSEFMYDPKLLSGFARKRYEGINPKSYNSDGKCCIRP